ncbi:unnamed protein product [Choristocarpus tenellus]|uniref:ribosomal protein S8 n=1 Tax=Choristocarpus tenellus TaxID=116065 RepID=UPI002E77AC76|nr:ribosomal protein S8 [Choristocarpus tenellus]WBP69798.1 ribosomal protein S8 [Choristocarpus tenellus]
MKSLSDIFTRIRNGQIVYKTFIIIPSVNICLKVLNIIWDEGFIQGYSRSKNNEIYIILRYINGRPAIRQLTAVSRPSQRIYISSLDLCRLKPNLGLLILSTPKGIMNMEDAIYQTQGGEVLCYIV